MTNQPQLPINLTEIGDAKTILQRWNAAGVKVNMCVTSPPYYGLRSYLPDKIVLRPEAPASVIAELEALGIFPNG